MSDGPDPRWSRAAGPLLGVLVLGLVLAGGAVFLVNRAGDDAAAPSDTLPSLCDGVHAGHNTMSWNPTMADEMTESGCPWPYEPFLVSAEGGEEESAFDAAPFGARLYAEIWSLLARSDVGVCSVGALTEPEDEALVFGFRYPLAEPGCPEATPVLDLVAREYGTRAHRDAAAMEASGGAVYVLGRWVLTVGETPEDMASGIDAELVALGASGGVVSTVGRDDVALTHHPASIRAVTKERRGWVDTGAPIVIWFYVLLHFQPLETLFVVPGPVYTLLFPIVGFGVLLLTPTERLSRVPISLPLVSLVAWFGLSLLWSQTPLFTEFLVRSQLVSLVVLGLVVGTMAPRQVVRTVLRLFVMFAVVTLVISLVLPTGRQTVIGEIEQLGFRGWFIHKNVMGAFMVCGLGVVLPFARGRGRRLVIGLFIVLIVCTRSATAAGGLLGVLFLWGCMSATASQRTPRERQFVITLSIGSAIAGVLLVLGLLPTILDLYDKDVTFSGRTDIWSESLVTINERPLQGYGLGGVWSVETDPVTLDLRHRIGFDAAHAHNSALELLLFGGIVGLGLTTVFVVQLVRLSVACLRQPMAAEYGRWGLLTLLALFLMGLAEPLFQGPYLGLLVVVWVTQARVRNDAVRAGTWLAPWARD